MLYHPVIPFQLDGGQTPNLNQAAGYRRTSSAVHGSTSDLLHRQSLIPCFRFYEKLTFMGEKFY